MPNYIGRRDLASRIALDFGEKDELVRMALADLGPIQSLRGDAAHFSIVDIFTPTATS